MTTTNYTKPTIEPTKITLFLCAGGCYRTTQAANVFCANCAADREKTRQRREKSETRMLWVRYFAITTFVGLMVAFLSVKFN